MDRPTADQVFHRHELIEASERVPESWMQETCAIGSVDQCVRRMQEFRDAGVDEIGCYGSTPADNAALIAAWRAASGEH